MGVSDGETFRIKNVSCKRTGMIQPVAIVRIGMHPLSDKSSFVLFVVHCLKQVVLELTLFFFNYFTENVKPVLTDILLLFCLQCTNH